MSKEHRYRLRFARPTLHTGELHPAGRVLHVTLDEACLLVRQGGCSLVHTDDAAIIAAALRGRLTSKRRLGSRLWR